MRKPSVYIGTPAHANLFSAPFALSLVKLAGSNLLDLGMSKASGCGITVARNHIAHDFLAARSPRTGKLFDRLQFIDADVDFEPHDVARINSHDVPIIGGLYPVKMTPSRWCLQPLGPEIKPDEKNGRQEVEQVGTGFLSIHRDVFTAMLDPAIAYENDWAERHGQTTHAFFGEGIVRSQRWPKGRYLTEDFWFCHRARELGFKVYVDTTFSLGHWDGGRRYSAADIPGALKTY